MTTKKTEEAAPTKALAVIPDAALALFEDNAGEGFEGTGGQDYALPFLKLIQKTNPEVDRNDAAYVPEAQPGWYIDSASKEVMETFEFIPCFYHRAMVEWYDRDEGGGFVGQHAVGTEDGLERDDRGRFITEKNAKGATVRFLADTRYFFGLRLCEDGSAKPGVVSLSSTQLKPAKTWMTQLADIKYPRGHVKAGESLPIFASIWRFGSVPQQNDKGSWSGYKIERSRMVDDAKLAARAREARAMFKGAATHVRPPDDAGGEGSTKAPSTAEVPF